jgi:hypothetical protein
LLTVSQVLVQLRYNHPELLTILGGKQAMIESPLINQIVAENTQETILTVLEARFGSVPEEIAERLRKLHGQKKLKALVKQAALCRDLGAFRKRL